MVSLTKGKLFPHTAHPDLMCSNMPARSRGIKVIIAGAGGAAHLPGMVCRDPSVIQVPVKSCLSVVDSLYSIVQMPGGVPVCSRRLVKLERLTQPSLPRCFPVEDQAGRQALAQFAEEQERVESLQMSSS